MPTDIVRSFITNLLPNNKIFQSHGFYKLVKRSYYPQFTRKADGILDAGVGAGAMSRMVDEFG